MKSKEELTREVLEMLEAYEHAFASGTRDDVQIYVKDKVVYVTDDDVQLRNRYPFDPVKFREMTNFSHGDAVPEVVHVDEHRAHVVFSGRRWNKEGTSNEIVSSSYILQHDGTAWKVAVISGIRTPTETVRSD